MPIKKPKARKKTNVRARKPKPPKQKWLLYVRPGGKKPPKWWPVGPDGKPAEVGVLDCGTGWVVGDGDPMDEGEIVFSEELFGFEIKKPVFRRVKWEG